MKRINEDKTYLFCDEDGEKIRLPPATGRIALSPKSRAEVTRDQVLSKLRTSYETALVSVKSFVRDRKDTALPTCFVSYAWGNTADERWVSRLADDLRNAAVDVVLDQLHNPAIGANIARFISRIAKSDYILVVGTPVYLQKYENEQSPEGSVLAAEVDLMGVRLLGTEQQKASILPVLLEGTQHNSLPPLLQGKVRADFTREESYFITLFDLVLTILQSRSMIQSCATCETSSGMKRRLWFDIIPGSSAMLVLNFSIVNDSMALSAGKKHQPDGYWWRSAPAGRAKRCPVRRGPIYRALG